ncbi:phosphatidate phosphatase PAH2-like isoform X7 [Chenopodium quinoa]|uniref:phosphatidate phosphatase PAH2-like isoform X7 n=1 Tax=Chenopodium quinoa TaxID=63459 RepID=UPI000B7790BB|nr:phosphatidate phosphatase PAH2-like isoform X7 [Chenopodium quinoa]
MFAVGRLGSYISRGVCTVSGPFHPFGGAVDVIVVEQQDGSFKSTPWYVRFGKFQGVLKATERVVSINVNGVDADFHMYLDHKGEAFFVKEVDGAEAESESYYSSPDEKEVNSDSWITQKSMSCNYDANRTEMISELEGSNGKITARTNSSRRGRIFRLPFGRRLMKENGFRDGNSSAEVDSVSSLERAEIAADLLEVRWTTNLRPGKNQTTSVSNATKKPSSVSSEGNVTSADLTSVGSNISDGVHDGCSKNNQISENIGKCNGDEDTLWNASTSHVTDVVGTSHQCSIGEVPLEYSSSGDPCKSATGSMNELSSEDLYAGTSGLNSLPIVSEKEGSVTNVTQCALSSSPKDPTRDRINEVTPSDDKEEQFLFSDLDDCKVEKVEHIQTSSSGSSLESSEGGLPKRTFTDESHHLTCNPAQDNLLINDASLKMNSNRMSCPISISKVHDDDAEEKALAPAAESLPIMVFDGDDPSRDARQTISRSLDSTLEAFKMVNNDVSAASGLSGGPQQVAQSRLEEIKNIISDPAVEVSLCRHLLFDGMGYEAAAQAFDAEKLDIDNFLSLGLDILKNDKLVVRIGGLYFPWDAALPIASAIGSQEKVPMLEPKGMIAVGQVENQSSEGVTQKSINSGNGSWRLWPFSFKKSNSMQNRNSSFETPAEDLKDIAGNSDAVVPRAMKKKIRAKFPTSEQLASLNLKEGKNVVTFTFSTAMLGEQKVEARIFLWKWNARIVVSDVDGTITKSDVLGQFMPMMGIDWSQTGVTHLFSAIKENGYQLLFLSARSISQAYHTRQFLFNLKQDGKALPEGPVLISPDGLFPSLYREVIRRAPHEFKIACLEDVKVLFPLDHNPFYAGFGNRDTDELSYLRVGMPRGKIFTINPKGQVVVNRRVDSKSYTSLHVLVHDMFPPTTFHEQEDYNSWNFWKLPPRDAI